MDFDGSETYDADLDTVYKAFCDGGFATARYENADATDVQVLTSEAEGDDGWILKTSRVVEADLPGFAKKVLSDTNTMIQTDHWGPESDGKREGSWDIETEGAPAKAHGTMTITDEGNGRTKHAVTGTVEVKVPLIGKKIANWAGGTAKDQLTQELAFNKANIGS